MPSGDSAEREILQRFYESPSDEAIVVMDAQACIVGWSKGSENLYGYVPSEMLGKSISKIYTLEDRAKHIDEFELEVARREGSSEDDRWHVRKDGSQIWVTGTLGAARTPDGELLGYVKIMRDRTDLRTRLELLESELASARERAESMRLFIDTLGHELRNPLGALSMALKVQDLDGSAANSAEVKRIVLRQLGLIERLTDDLRDVSQVERSVLQMTSVPLVLQEVLGATVDDFRAIAESKGLELRATYQDAPIAVHGDAQRLSQLFNNLLSNALRYTPSGGSIAVRAVEEVDEAVVRIDDSGIGIGSDMLPKLFKLFSRSADARSMVPAGLGIGLALSNEIIHRHGGNIAVRSAGSGKGTQVVLRFPLSAK